MATTTHLIESASSGTEKRPVLDGYQTKSAPGWREDWLPRDFLFRLETDALSKSVVEREAIYAEWSISVGK
jgi:hypothetical protein